jgi:hypothetical protein
VECAEVIGVATIVAINTAVIQVRESQMQDEGTQKLAIIYIYS